LISSRKLPSPISSIKIDISNQYKIDAMLQLVARPAGLGLQAGHDSASKARRVG
jgi:hypothetical protein